MRRHAVLTVVARPPFVSGQAIPEDLTQHPYSLYEDNDSSEWELLPEEGYCSPDGTSRFWYYTVQSDGIGVCKQSCIAYGSPCMGITYTDHWHKYFDPEANMNVSARCCCRMHAQEFVGYPGQFHGPPTYPDSVNGSAINTVQPSSGRHCFLYNPTYAPTSAPTSAPTLASNAWHDVGEGYCSADGGTSRFQYWGYQSVSLGYCKSQCLEYGNPCLGITYNEKEFVEPNSGDVYKCCCRLHAQKYTGIPPGKYNPDDPDYPAVVYMSGWEIAGVIPAENRTCYSYHPVPTVAPTAAPLAPSNAGGVSSWLSVGAVLGAICIVVLINIPRLRRKGYCDRLCPPAEEDEKEADFYTKHPGGVPGSPGSRSSLYSMALITPGTGKKHSRKVAGGRTKGADSEAERLTPTRLTPAPLSPVLPANTVSAQSFGQRTMTDTGFGVIETEEIGRGAFGKVFKALGPRGELLAVKHVTMGVGEAAEEARREYQLMSHLRHPHVVHVYRLMEDSNDRSAGFRIVMEFMAGGSVAGMVKEFGPLREPACASYIAQAMAGLEHMHARGVVHSDIKPSNLLVQANGALKLADFGLCRRVVQTMLGDLMPGGAAVLDTGEGAASEAAQRVAAAAARMRQRSNSRKGAAAAADAQPGARAAAAEPEATVVVAPSLTMTMCAMTKMSFLSSRGGATSPTGTLPYMSPLLLTELLYSIQSDLWALGCTLTEMATGLIPWSDRGWPADTAIWVENIVQTELNGDRPTGADGAIQQLQGCDLSPGLMSFAAACLNAETAEPPTTSTDLLQDPFIAGILGELDLPRKHSKLSKGRQASANPSMPAGSLQGSMTKPLKRGGSIKEVQTPLSDTESQLNRSEKWEKVPGQQPRQLSTVPSISSVKSGAASQRADGRVSGTGTPAVPPKKGGKERPGARASKKNPDTPVHSVACVPPDATGSSSVTPYAEMK